MTTPPSEPVEQQICFLLHATSRAVIGLYRADLDRLKLTYTQYLVLVLLFEQSLTMREAGARLLMDSATLTPVTKRMEAAGLLSRHRDPDDERQLVLTLTDAGRAIEGELVDMRCRAIASTGLPLDEMMDLRDSLADALQRMTQHAASRAAAQPRQT